ncbi:hypothetical protein E4U42_004531 [Claviceps africana]|uniref:RNA-dependent RNA polymerase n=1 Tax=Claviceps africana TaxID=83212 RepID=A0A8K0NKR3_9HYPO|nr:hypothetical protein E4U42_004531 [Claviceps africana]
MAAARAAAAATSSASRDEWRRKPSLTLEVNGLPLDVSARQIWQWFSPEGAVAFIDLKSSEKAKSATVKFEPPPRSRFWTNGFSVSHPDIQRHPAGLKLYPSEDVGVGDTRDRHSVNDASQMPNSSSKSTLLLESLGFGCMVKPTLMHVRKLIPANPEVKLELDPRQNLLTLFFSCSTNSTSSNQWATYTEYKIVIRISSIKTALEAYGDKWRYLVLALPRPPEYFRKLENILDTFQGNLQRWSSDRTWRRATNILQDNKAHLGLPVSLHDEHEDSHINIGRWTALRLSFNANRARDDSAYEALISALSKCNVFRHPNCEFDTGKAVSVFEYLDHPSTGSISQQPSALLEMAPTVHLDFNVRYQLEVCVSRGILCEYAVGLAFLQRLAAMSCLDATRRLEYLADTNERISEPMDLFEMEDAEFYVPNTRVPDYCVSLRKISITPTTMLLSSPIVETSNRIFRKYSRFQDRFLRIQFLGESEFGRIFENSQENEDIWRRVRRTLSHGIRIGSRVYRFLAFGSSQLRECSAFFFCPTDHVSCDDIRKWMGDLDHIKVVGKYAARLGQCFSTTREIKGVPVPRVNYVPDIERNGFCFTDGVGLVSKFQAQAITQDMKLDVLSEPTAFQIRMSGCKGVLAVWPQIKWDEVHIRPSQEKFKSSSKSLEVIKCASRATATLNRQTIVILESLGVPRHVFMNLLAEQIKAFENAAHDTSAALELLTKFVDERQNTLVLAELLKANFETADTFTANLLKLWISWSFKLLREKARLHVAKSAFVLGCVDETGTLRGHCRETEGSAHKDINQLPQIFLQLTDPAGPQKTVIKGVCIVGRNPSLHPGDIRVVQAVDNPKLRHLTDVVVFASTGDRPVPNMLSGGDLDGDDFFIIWDPNIIPSQWNYPPMNYEGPKPQELSRDVTVDDLQDFFLNYMKNDTLGLIATAHMAHADRLGPKSQTCLDLAEKHSQAVDYPKTGEPAKFDLGEYPTTWPHFMEKRRSYRSEKALGVMHDMVVKHSPKFDPSWEHAFDRRITQRFETDPNTREAVRAVKLQYDISVRRLLAQYEVGTEFELYTSWCLSKPKIGSDYKRQESLGQEYDALKQRFREQCYNLLERDKSEEQLDRFVAAMYVVTEEEVKAALKDVEDPVGGEECRAAATAAQGDGSTPTMPLISFPWIFHWVLIRIVMGNSYKPGKAIMAAARRMPAVNPKMQSLFGDPHSHKARADTGGMDGTVSTESRGGSAKSENATIGTAEDVARVGRVDDAADGDAADGDEADGDGADGDGADEQESWAETFKVDLGEDAAVDRLIALMGRGE